MVEISRRGLMAGTGAGILSTPFLMTRAAVAAPAAAPAPAGAVEAEFHRFRLGSFEVTVIKDGMRPSDKPNETFGTDQPAEDVGALLGANFLPADRFVNSFAPVLVHTGQDLVLFDTGLGEKAREGGMGRLMAGMAAAGYKPEDVTVVVITHMHGDHIGGIMEGGKPAFPKARYVMGAAEFDFWKDPARAGTPAEGNHQAVLASIVPLAEKTTFVKDGDEVLPGIAAIAAAGHTPGHMIFRIESDKRPLLLTADTANHYVLSLQRPDWEVKFDMDKAAAAATRKRVFDMVASEKMAFLGYHMPFPAVGFVEKLDTGYRFVPKSYQFDL